MEVTEDTKILKNKRRYLKGRLTKFKKYIDELDTNALSEADILGVKDRLEKFEPVWYEWTEVETNLCLINGEVDEDESTEFENCYYKLIGTTKLIINNLSRSRIQTPVISENFAIENNNSIKLPPISLPKFDGQYSSWFEFRDAFLALVDSSSSMTDYQKFYYLKQALSEEAQKTIKSLQVTNANYKIAWKKMKDRYESEAMMIHSHIKNIFECPSVQRESPEALRNLFEQVTNSLASLESLGEGVQTWDRLIIYILTSKFDPVTKRDWESYKYPGAKPSLNDIELFLSDKCKTLEKLSVDKGTNYNKANNQLSKKSVSCFVANENKKCSVCNADHLIYNCEAFLRLNPSERCLKVKELKLCLNCLKQGHQSWKCKSRKCLKCQKSHNTLLHIERVNNNFMRAATDQMRTPAVQTNTGTEQTGAAFDVNRQNVSGDVSNTHLASTREFEALLSTAVVCITKGQEKIYCRALLDSGSQGNFITETLINKLGVKPKQINHAVRGVGGSLTNIQYQANIVLKSCYNNYKAEVNCLILPKITDKLPRCTFSKEGLNIPKGVNLADPKFNISNSIDLLLGSTIFWGCLCQGQQRLGENMPILQNSKFGWILAGNLNLIPSNNSLNFHVLNTTTVTNNTCQLTDEIITKFWSIEEMNNKNKILSVEETLCEAEFDKTTERTSCGRFLVRMPFKENVHKLGDSRQIAINRFFSLERKLSNNLDLKREYCDFINEYQKLGHMTEIKKCEESEEGYFIPHHAVIKPNSLTTRCRVVFDASSKSTSGLSLNDVQRVGPTLQQDIFSILMRFRKYNFVVTADISKMYRQILIQSDQRKYLKIFWRNSIDDELKCFHLNTVTYGTASAPYLAVKCLMQLGINCEQIYPLASQIIQRDFYMDDLLTGADTVDVLLQIQSEVFQILKGGGFLLRKWLSNDIEIMKKFKVGENLELNLMPIGENEASKTLGVYWDADNDTIKYNINHIKANVTKRKILAVTCQIFDPLGLLGPIVIIAKLIMQELWQKKIEWDAEVPEELANRWLSFESNLIVINEFKIPRQVTSRTYTKLEIHGFCDASEKAYGACVYIRCIDLWGKITCNLLCAKSRVAPLKKISLPRLELCGAVLLAQLYKKVINSLDIAVNNTYLWTDSTIVICWINGEPSRWHTFVANRVSEIQSLSQITDWHHVQSIDNPADILSRGCHSLDLKACNLWWQGPDWLLLDSSNWKLEESVQCKDIPELKSFAHVTQIKTYTNELISNLINNCSCYNKSLRILAFCLRYASKIKKTKRLLALAPDIEKVEILTVQEINTAECFLIKEIQKGYFFEEYESLKYNKELNRKSAILSLNPFLDNGLIRVGGRLKNARETFDKKFPLILPKSLKITELIIKSEHERLFHCGFQQLLASVRERYWPLGARNMCKKIIRNCLICIKSRPKGCLYLMGNLPEVRVNAYSPFLNVGVDYSGPFLIKDRKTRNPKMIKAYLCLFICLSTKAVHLDLVTDLDSQAFMATLKRFIGRRGRPSNIFSDNGSNFKGTNTDINNLYKFLKDKSPELADKLSCEKIQWNFIPPRSPNFGGLWESNIKSVKRHLKNIIGNNSLTYEDFLTVLIQIESILNSRPLSPLSTDPNDLNPLTPGHFLIGRQLTSIPEQSLIELHETRLKRFQQLQRMVQQFWFRWKREYLVELQQRSKWKQKSSEILKVGTMVLLQGENTYVSEWVLARITKLYPGEDGVVRVVDVKTAKGELRRPVTKLCILPSVSD